MRLTEMGLNELVYWYQKKIGTYDKQQWERTIEQHILGGLTHVPMRTAKLKTELIDVDLVRGSSFPKAKPKHGLSTVACLAFQRLLFLPLYKKWWIQQTSYRIFMLFLLLYSLQAINIFLYYIYANKENETEIVSISEVLIPIVMMFILCIVHSHIVSTHSGPTMTCNQSRQRITRRSRHIRCRSGKSRSRMNLRIHKDLKSTQDREGSEKASIGSEEVLTAVRFAKKLVIENSLTVSQSQESVTAQIVFDKESISTTSETSNPINEVLADCEQPGIVPEEHAANVHQDDDGFESLNGNVSSDNDKIIRRATVRRNRPRDRAACQAVNCTPWSEDNASQQILIPSQHLGKME